MLLTFVFKALRKALYDQDHSSTKELLAATDDKIELVVDNTAKYIAHGGAGRINSHVEVTAPPSDISSIDGNDDTRSCHTPNSISSTENKVNTNLKKSQG